MVQGCELPAMSSAGAHVLLFPYPLQGHINPLFALARCLASSGLRVIFLHTAPNFRKLQGQPIPPNIHLQALDEEDAAGEPPSIAFEHSMQKLEKGLERFLEQLRRRNVTMSALVADLLMPWTCDAAKRAQIPSWYQFSPFPALTILCALNVRAMMEKGLLPFRGGREDETLDWLPVRPALRLRDVPLDFLTRPDEEHLQVLVRIMERVGESAGMVLNTVYELEKETVDALRKDGMTVYPVGPLVAAVDWSADCDEGVGWASEATSLLDEDETCLAWLDRQPASSVLYVAFGSLVELAPQEIEQLALALEASGVRFLWALRQHDHANGLPPGFSARTHARGLVVGWAPQTRVLSHPSILGTLTHCGCSSVFEALLAGVPMIGIPKLSDHNSLLRLITRDWGVGIPAAADVGQEALPLIARHYFDKVYAVDQTAVEKSVRALASGEDGHRVRQRALELRSTIREAVATLGVSTATLHDLASALLGAGPPHK